MERLGQPCPPMSPGEGLPGLGDLLAGGQIAGARPYQEDDYRIVVVSDREQDECDFLMVLADGMGGHRGGAEASRVAVAAFVAEFAEAGGTVDSRLRRALDAANSAVEVRAAGDSRLEGMGCTVVGCAVTGREEAHWISVGDSPLWCVRVEEGGRAAITRLNADHSMRPVLEELVRRGQLAEDEVDSGSHQLRSAVVGGRLPLVDEGQPPVRLGAGDRLVLASDGLETLPEDEILRRCAEPGEATDIVRDLLRSVDLLARPHQDNATVLVYRHEQRSAVHSRLARLTAPTRPANRR